MKVLQKQRVYDSQRDAYYRKVERENLDGYGWAMSLDVVKTPEEILLTRQRFERLERQIDQLRPRIGRVLRLRLGINCKVHTLDEIAGQYNVNKERIRQLEAEGLRIIKRRIWIEEKPEDYQRERENVARAYKERIELERQHAEARVIARQRQHDAEAIAAVERQRQRDAEAPEDRQRREQAEAQRQFPLHKSGILDEIVKEQKRAVALEFEYRGWAGGRERALIPASSLYGNREWHPYRYKLRHVPIRRDWLNVATEGFRDGA